MAEILKRIRDGLLKNINFHNNSSQLLLLMRFAIVMILPDIERKGDFSDSASYESGSEDSRRKLRVLSKKYFNDPLWEDFAPILKDPFFGAAFRPKLENYRDAFTSLALHFALIQNYKQYLRKPSVLIGEIAKAWPHSNTKNLLRYFIVDLDSAITTPFSKEERFGSFWNNFLKNRSRARTLKTKKRAKRGKKAGQKRGLLRLESKPH